MARLSDTQREILRRAVPNAGLIIPLPRNGKERGARRALLRRGLLIETRSQPGVLEWRYDQEGTCWALGISTTGREAIGRDEPLLPDCSTVIAGRIAKVFVEAHGREPATIRELEAPPSRRVAAVEAMTEDERLPPALGVRVAPTARKRAARSSAAENKKLFPLCS